MGPLAVVRFASELTLLAALGYVGWQLGGDPFSRVALAVVLPIAAAAVWATFIGPRAGRRLTDPTRFAVEVALFVVAVVGLVVCGQLLAAIVVAVLYAVGTTHGRRGG
ncbi:MAG: YrdB family protein [Nocardioidaceae bacterium]